MFFVLVVSVASVSAWFLSSFVRESAQRQLFSVVSEWVQVRRARSVVSRARLAWFVVGWCLLVSVEELVLHFPLFHFVVGHFGLPVAVVIGAHVLKVDG